MDPTRSLEIGTLSLLGTMSLSRFLNRTAFADSPIALGKVLLTIFQRGAVDGLSMVIPHREQASYAARTALRSNPPSWCLELCCWRSWQPW